MAPTKSIPAAFHSELSEYVSLLRAIRTNSTLDIVPQLTRAIPHVQSSDYDSDRGSSLENEEDTQASDEEDSREASEPIRDRKVKRSSKGKARDKTPSKSTKQRKRTGDDNWTRWPLLKEHCPLPEWAFDEEVMAIAEQCLRSRTSPSHDPNGSEVAATSIIKDSDGDYTDDFTLSPAHLSGLTSEAASKLTSILSLLASHRPHATFTKHGRLAPLSWVDVLEIVGVAGIFDLSTVEDVKERMEATFGPSQSHIITRMQVLEASRRALAEAETSFGNDLSQIRPPPSCRRKKQKQPNTSNMRQQPVVNEHQTSS